MENYESSVPKNFRVSDFRNEIQLHEIIIIFEVDVTSQSEALKNKPRGSLSCSLPRKSLVKGERFFRYERKPELIGFRSCL